MVPRAQSVGANWKPVNNCLQTKKVQNIPANCQDTGWPWKEPKNLKKQTNSPEKDKEHEPFSEGPPITTPHSTLQW